MNDILPVEETIQRYAITAEVYAAGGQPDAFNVE